MTAPAAVEREPGAMLGDIALWALTQGTPPPSWRPELPAPLRDLAWSLRTFPAVRARWNAMVDALKE